MFEEEFKQIKKEFYCLRNGIISEHLNKIYHPGKLVFGLNAPQFMELSQKYPKNLDLGKKLWKDKNCRESRILALYLIPPKEIEKKEVIDMIKEVESVEEAEFLAFRILRHIPYSKELYEQISNENLTDPMVTYCISMFKKNIDQI